MNRILKEMIEVAEGTYEEMCLPFNTTSMEGTTFVVVVVVSECVGRGVAASFFGTEQVPQYFKLRSMSRPLYDSFVLSSLNMAFKSMFLAILLIVLVLVQPVCYVASKSPWELSKMSYSAVHLPPSHYYVMNSRIGHPSESFLIMNRYLQIPIILPEYHAYYNNMVFHIDANPELEAVFEGAYYKMLRCVRYFGCMFMFYDTECTCFAADEQTL